MRTHLTAVLHDTGHIGKLFPVDAFRAQVENGLENIFFLDFAGFNQGLTYFSCGQDTLVAT